MRREYKDASSFSLLPGLETQIKPGGGGAGAAVQSIGLHASVTGHISRQPLWCLEAGAGGGGVNLDPRRMRSGCPVLWFSRKLCITIVHYFPCDFQG